MHSRNSFRNGLFGKRISKIIWKFNFIFYGICYEKQTGPRINYHPLLRLPNMFRSVLFCSPSLDHFWCLLIQRDFGIFPKIAIGNLYKPFHDVVIIKFLTFSWNHKTLGKKKENIENLNMTTWRSKRTF